MRGQTASTRRRRRGSDPADGVLPRCGVGRSAIGQHHTGSPRQAERPSASGRSPTGGSHPGDKAPRSFKSGSPPMRRPLKLCARPLRLYARRLKLYARRPHEFRTRRPPILMRLASNAVGRGSYRKAPANRVSRRPSANARSNRPPHPVSVQSHRERSTWVSRPARQPRLESSSFAAVRLGCAASLEPVARLGRSAPLGCAPFGDRRAS